MSFILDALKKAEAERQRQTGPTLLEVRVTAPRRRFPLWTLIIGGLLGINIVLLLVFALRRPSANAVAPAAAMAPAPAAASSTPAAAATTPAANAAAAPVAGSTVSPASALAAAETATRGGIGGDTISDNPADFEPAVPAAGVSNQRRAADAGARSEPPSLSEFGGDLPDLRLDLHVYAARAADRYALINMHRVREGDVLPEGPRVLAIDRDGVELSYRGTEFMLHPQ